MSSKLFRMAGALGLGAVSSLAVSSAWAACTYSTTGGINYWTCSTPYPADLEMTSSKDTVELGSGVTITGDVLGKGDNDSITISGATIGGLVNAGSGNDTLVFSSGTLTGKLRGGEGDDTITVSGGTLNSNVEGDDGWDKIYIQGGTIKGTVIGDEVYVSGGTIEGNISGGSIGQANIIEVTGGTVQGTIYGYEGDDQITLKGGTVAGVSGGDGRDTILIQPLTSLTINGRIRGNDGGDTVTFDGAVEGVNLTLNVREVDGGDDFDRLNVINGSSLRLTVVDSFGEVQIKGSALTLDGTSYSFAPNANNGGVFLDGTASLSLTAATVSVTTMSVGLGTSLDPGGVLFIGKQTATAASFTVNGTFSNYGTIALADGVANDSLVITGAYLGGASAGGANGTAGNVTLDVATLGSGGTADTVTLQSGAVTGTTTLHVAATGKGGYTGHDAGDGILVVSAASATSVGADAFQLAVNGLTGQRNVLAGAFAYDLVEFNGDYYLQSSLLSQVPAYTIGPAVAATYAFMAFNTLDRRLGELRQGDALPGAGQSGWQAWARVFGGSVDVSPSAGWGFSQDAAISQFGFDRRLETSAGQLHVGAFAGYGSTEATVGGAPNVKANLDGWSLGAYATYFSDARPGLGAYVDLVAKVDILDASFTAPTGSGSTDTTSWGVSGEVGYGFALPGNLVLKPQAELTYLNTRQDGFTDSLGLVVQSATLEDLVGRLGVQLQSTLIMPDGSAHTPYLTANVLHDFLGDGSVGVAGTTFEESLGGTWYTLGAGITSNIRANFALYAQGAYSMGDVQGWTGNLGLRARW